MIFKYIGYEVLKGDNIFPENPAFQSYFQFISALRWVENPPVRSTDQSRCWRHWAFSQTQPVHLRFRSVKSKVSLGGLEDLKIQPNADINLAHILRFCSKQIVFFCNNLVLDKRILVGMMMIFWGIGKKVGKMRKTTRICMKLQEYQVDFPGYSIVPFPISNDYDRKQHFKQKQPKNKITCALDTGFWNILCSNICS